MTPAADPRASQAAQGAAQPGVDDDTVWRTLVGFCAYRIVVALLLSLGYGLFNNLFAIGLQQPALAGFTVIAYLVAAGMLLVPALMRKPSITLQVTLQVVVDTAAVVMLMYASGGIRSGLGVVLLMSLAGAGLISRGRLAFLNAAIAAIAVLGEHFIQVVNNDAPPADFLQSGLMSLAYFATAGLGSTLARYARASQKIAEQRSIDLANLSQINELVIRDMQDGFLVVDEKDAIRQHNPRCAQMLGPVPGRGSSLRGYSPELAHLLANWRGDPRPAFFTLGNPSSAAELQVHFVAIGTGEPPPTVIFIEDVGRMREHAQQMKLVALGRLTASIAHEIRNPLSSIGHAAELLSEDVKEKPEQRLISIIRDNVFRLDRLVQEVLYLNRRDRAEPEAIEPRAYLANFVHEFCASEKVPERGVVLDLRTQQRMRFDRQHLDQVLWNLARNAWRHGRKGEGSLRIALSPGPATGTLALDVFDDGLGVLPEAQAHLFEPFFTTDAQGTGLGLYIARELCDGSGANLNYMDDATGGQFRVTMKGA
jgi:two-component system sensor histidine kinase PilS (NtrC family)